MAWIAGTISASWLPGVCAGRAGAEEEGEVPLRLLPRAAMKMTMATTTRAIMISPGLESPPEEEGPQQALEGCYIVVVKPDVAVSTRDAYAKITPREPQKCCRDIVCQPIETWRNELVNDFEQPVFALYPQLAEIKEKLYSLGAVFALMSGSGSALFGIFRNKPEGIDVAFPDCATFVERL